MKVFTSVYWQQHSGGGEGKGHPTHTVLGQSLADTENHPNVFHPCDALGYA